MVRPIDPFEDEPATQPADDLVLRLAAYEGPIDLLLEQARLQKVDLTQISILALADQYLAFVEHARSLRLELAADYLVMAAWLAYLKSRLLLPEPPRDDEPSGAAMAEALAFQLRRLEAMRRAGERLMRRPRLGIDVFACGSPQSTTVHRRTVPLASLYDLLRAYAEHKRRRERAAGSLRIEASQLYSTDDALQRLTEMLGGAAGWTTLAEFLPGGLGNPLIARSAVAATLAASLELVKSGHVELRQDAPFAPVYLRRRPNRRTGTDDA